VVLPRLGLYLQRAPVETELELVVPLCARHREAIERWKQRGQEEFHTIKRWERALMQSAPFRSAADCPTIARLVGLVEDDSVLLTHKGD
jgi:hypothetical protein